ncbi:MAG: hypothetical protein GY719_31550 [bacterium]|nr:hypothetical protein [bacterium]
MREVTEPATAHTCATPSSLALDMDELEEDQLREIEDRVSSCGTCLEGLEMLVYWLDALGHWDPRVGPEFLVRHHRMAKLLFFEETHRERLDRVRIHSRFQDWGLARLLIEESRRASPQPQFYSCQLAELSHTIAEVLDREFYGPQWVEDLRAEAAANLAVLERGRDRLEESSRLLGLARQCLGAGTGRAEVSRFIEDAESLFARDNLSLGALDGLAEGTESQSLSAQVANLPRPVHQLLERCRAARQGR